MSRHERRRDREPHRPVRILQPLPGAKKDAFNPVDLLRLAEVL
jgi:hypothetical protein